MVPAMFGLPARWVTTVAAFIVLFSSFGHAKPRRVRLDLRRTTVVGDVSERFLSVAVDMDQLVGGTFWDPAGGPSQVDIPPYDFSRTHLRRLAGALAPAYMRLGGSASDRTFYDVTDPPLGMTPDPYDERLTRAQWNGAMAFANDLGFAVIVTLNAGPGPRAPDGRWTDDNARALLTYAAARSDPVAVLELGNEPNLFAVRAELPGYTAEDYARDLGAFVELRDAVLPAALVSAPGNIFTRGQGEELLPGAMLVFGPRTTETLPLVGSRIDIVAYHYYAAISTRCPASGPRVDTPTALEGPYLDGIDEPTHLVGALRDAHATGKPLWITESGGQSCGGQIGVADRFVNSFWFLNTLGRTAHTNQQVFVRQTLSGSSYGLLDEITLTPRPDYWAALLWRRVMGTRVLAAPDVSDDPALRVFAHCHRDGARGATAALVLNTSTTTSARVRVRRTSRKRPGLRWVVTAPALDATTILVNGVSPQQDVVGTPILPAAVPVRGAFTLPPTSYAFVVVPAARNARCVGEQAASRRAERATMR
jgi:hypothetical protein